MRVFKLYAIVLLVIFFILITSLRNDYWKTAPVEKCPKIITVVHGGNLGNCIFEYMSLFAVANLYKEAKFVPYCEDSLRKILEKFFQNVSIPGKNPNIPKHCYDMNKSYKWPVQKSITLDDIVQLNQSLTLAMYSARYVEIIKYGVDKIKEELKFKKDHMLYTDKLLTELKAKFNWTNENVTFVGMHYRGTDYIHHLKLFYKSFKPLPTYKFYNEAMAYFVKKYKKVIFVLTTIDDDWLNENLVHIQKDKNVIVNPSGKDAVKDLVILAHCNHSIINYGTFGATAALLNKGTTFVYDLNITLDYRGPTIAMGIAHILPNWHLL